MAWWECDSAVSSCRGLRCLPNRKLSSLRKQGPIATVVDDLGRSCHGMTTLRCALAVKTSGRAQNPVLRLSVPAFAGTTPSLGDRRATQAHCFETHIGGVMPSRPTLTRLASSTSSFFTAPKMMILLPALTSDLSLATKVTIGVSGGT